MNFNLSMIYVHNIIDKEVQISKHIKLNKIINLKKMSAII